MSKWDPKKERAIKRNGGVQKCAKKYYAIKNMVSPLNMRGEHGKKNGLSIAHIVIEIETSEPSTLNASKVLFWGVVVFFKQTASYV